MNRNQKNRLLLIIGIGLVVLIVTYLGFSALYNSTAPTEDEIDNVAAAGTQEDALELLERSNRAETIQNLSMIVIGIEVVLATVFLVRELKK